MAEMQMPQSAAAQEQANSLGTMANWAGALVSLGLVIGVAVWGYKILVRDVSGVPVVRAAEGPMRVQPDDPGGRPAAHQGLAVNAVAAEGVAAAPADRLILAPPPLELSLEDAPMASIEAVAAAPARKTPPAKPRAVAGADTSAGAEPGPEMAAIQALAEQLSSGVAPLSEPRPVAQKAPEPKPETVAAVASEPAPEPEEHIITEEVKAGLGRSLRPRARPAMPEKIETVAATAPQGVRDVAPGSIPAGTRLAQLGAFESEEVARKEWERLSTRFGDYLEGKDRVIQRATSGGRVFYRLRAHGFDDLSDARRFCSALVAEQAECIPVVTR